MTEEEFDREFKSQVRWLNDLYLMGQLTYQQWAEAMRDLNRVYDRYYYGE